MQQFVLQSRTLCECVVIFLIAAGSVCAEEMIRIDSDHVSRHINTLASPEYRGRRGSDAQRAAEYVVDHFSRAGLQPVFPEQSFLQTIPGPRTAENLPTVAGWNVTGMLTPPHATRPDEYILLAAHHDHLGVKESGIYAGADDNASGVAMVLEAIPFLQQHINSLDCSVLFVSFDLEEHLLFGSRWWTAHPPVELEKIRLVIVADMLGRSLGDLPLNSVFLFGAEHTQGLKQEIRQIPWHNIRTSLLSDDYVGLRSDYGPFRDRKIPFLFASTGQSRDYHSIRDVPAKIDHQQVASITEGLCRLIIAISQKPDQPVWIDSPQTDQEEVQAVLEICNQIDHHAAEWNLSPIQRFFVSQATAEATRLSNQTDISSADQQRLTRLTQMLLLTVF
ncbi:MAG: M28 family peptidase [Planctomycetaceae bacterium]|nr:M28 family peptidase [Planctomycetaceae bacterium]